MLRIFGLVVLAGGIALLASGCASLASREDVSVTLIDLLPTRATVFETGATMTLRYTNEAPAPIELKGSAHRLFLNGSYVGRAVSNDAVTVPQLGTATQTVTLYLENLALFRKAAEFSSAPAVIAYRLESQLYPADAQNARRIRTVASGQIDLRALMQGSNLAAPSPR
jgi:LEA14-like dessication related protein